ncbi:hypothetical protein TrRE_jg4726, partial [Triparma retinervis]
MPLLKEHVLQDPTASIRPLAKSFLVKCKEGQTIYQNTVQEAIEKYAVKRGGCNKGEKRRWHWTGGNGNVGTGRKRGDMTGTTTGTFAEAAATVGGAEPVGRAGADMPVDQSAAAEPMQLDEGIIQGQGEGGGTREVEMSELGDDDVVIKNVTGGDNRAIIDEQTPKTE